MGRPKEPIEVLTMLYARHDTDVETFVQDCSQEDLAELDTQLDELKDKLNTAQDE